MMIRLGGIERCRSRMKTVNIREGIGRSHVFRTFQGRLVVGLLSTLCESNADKKGGIDSPGSEIFFEKRFVRMPQDHGVIVKSVNCGSGQRIQ